MINLYGIARFPADKFDDLIGVRIQQGPVLDFAAVVIDVFEIRGQKFVLAAVLAHVHPESPK